MPKLVLTTRTPRQLGFGIAAREFTLRDNGYLPQELFDMIIPFIVGDSLTMCAFSNVCRAWYLAAQPHRLRDVRLTTRNAHSFKHLLRTTPSIRARVRRLRIDYWRPHPSGFAQDVVPPDLRFITWLKNVTTLRLDTLVVTPSLIRQLSEFFAQVAELTLGELHVVSLSYVPRFMRAFTSVRKLTLTRTPLLHQRSVIRNALHESPRWWYPESECVGSGRPKEMRQWFRARKMAATVMSGFYRVLGGRRKPATAWFPKGGSIFFQPLLHSLPMSIEHLVVHESARLGGTPQSLDGGLSIHGLDSSPPFGLGRLQHIEFKVTHSVLNMLPDSAFFPCMLRYLKSEATNVRSIRVVWEPISPSCDLGRRSSLMLESIPRQIGDAYFDLEDITFELVGNAPPWMTKKHVDWIERRISVAFPGPPSGVPVTFENHVRLQVAPR